MQDAILRLTSFWTERGCILGQPMNTEVGAGTLNPATFLRVLGPEPWHVAYVEPSVRPDDSRYGDNPNRMQTHTQFQVILKPDPGDPQELYLESLAALGIDTRVHDVRFVEDNWESPALGAWGLGWEVWLDGLEITQFTYFQQAGGISLDPVAVELTYGMERILMALQGVSHFKDIRFSDDFTYGELQGQAELEMSRYYLDEADVETNRRLFELYEAEAGALTKSRLAIPAHYYVLKCSHTFNVLDARGAVGTTERARAFGRMRRLARDVAELWLERREELDHPLGTTVPPRASPAVAGDRIPDEAATFVLEVGSEELPPAQVAVLTEHLATLLGDALDSNRLSFDALSTYGSPRRIVAIVDRLAPRQQDHTAHVRGPRADVAFDAEGTPTRAGEGFARRHGVAPADLDRQVVDGVSYVAVTHVERGRATADVLADVLPGVVGQLSTDRMMRWRAGSAFAYPRPMRWIVALLGGAVVPFAYADIASGRVSRVLRDDPEPTLEVPSAEGYAELLRARGVEWDAERRRRAIVDGAQALAATVSGSIDFDAEAAILDEVTNLVENPEPLLGAFDTDYLRLPDEVLMIVMKKHQRYFPVRGPDGGLLPHFVTVANGPVDAGTVRAGNEAVLRARYADAAFFFDRDRASRLEDFRPGLASLMFEERAGTMLERSDRIARLAEVLADRLGCSDDELAVLRRAAFLAKADLATSMVAELSGLAGQIGRIYALSSGERPEVAEAIYEHVLPRYAGDSLPHSRVGAVLSIADRADALVALFATGANPTGSADPYGLRRAGAALAQTIVECGLVLDLADVFRVAGEGLATPVPDHVLEGLLEFVARRLEQRLLDEGHSAELVRAVSIHFSRPAEAVAVLRDLEGLIKDPDFRRVVTAYRRVARISRGVEASDVKEALLHEAVEQELWSAFLAVRGSLAGAPLPAFAEQFAPLVPKIDALFDGVMVMADDDELRANRLSLLANIRASGSHVLDWEAVPES